jgi:hypothetical protein
MVDKRKDKGKDHNMLWSEDLGGGVMDRRCRRWTIAKAITLLLEVENESMGFLV